MGGMTGGSDLPCDAPPNLNAEGQPNGYLSCSENRLYKLGPARCSGGCETDAGCGEGQVCVCEGAEPGLCLTAACEGPDSCETGRCARSRWDDGCDLVEGVYCETPEDTCSLNSDCPENMCGVRSLEEGWTCQSWECAIGRPPIVEGEVLTAPLIEREGWSMPHATLVERLSALSTEAREALERAWEELAALEHSSVASFARATLELMALGAPAELLLETQRAAADEVKHAEEVYSWLSALKGLPVGPGAFPSERLSPRVDLRDITLSLAREACLCETLGVAEVSAARELVQGARGPEAISAHLAQVEADETRHAALAWRTLAWLMESATDTLRHEVIESFERGARELLSVEPEALKPEHTSALSCFGVLSAAQRYEARLSAAREVIAPALHQLFGERFVELLSAGGASCYPLLKQLSARVA